MAGITSNNRPYGGGHFNLTIDGANAGWIKDVDGGHATGEVITEKLGADVLFRKTISNVKYEDVSFKCGTGMSQDFYKWVEQSFKMEANAGNSGRKNGAIHVGDYDYKEVSTLDFYEALITELGMPALDAASKDAAAMTVKFTPEKTRYKSTQGGGGKLVKGSPSKQKLWTAANFILNIDGLENCDHVTKVDALTIKQKVVQHYTGKSREYQIEPTSVETPNLVITLAEAYAKPFYDWHEDFVIKGNCEDKNEKTGSLKYLAQNVSESDPLFTLNFKQLGVFKVTPEKVEVGDKIRYVKVEMYCERIEFQYNKPVLG